MSYIKGFEESLEENIEVNIGFVCGVVSFIDYMYSKSNSFIIFLGVIMSGSSENCLSRRFPPGNFAEKLLL